MATQVLRVCSLGGFYQWSSSGSIWPPSIEMAATSLCCQHQGLSVTSHDKESLILLKYTLFNKKMLSGFPGHVCMLSHFSSVQLFGTLWTVALHAPLSTGSSKQEYWNG